MNDEHAIRGPSYVDPDAYDVGYLRGFEAGAAHGVRAMLDEHDELRRAHTSLIRQAAETVMADAEALARLALDRDTA
jgi:hypothetical protein